NEGTVGETVGEEFAPTLYGMPATYDDQGNYMYPDGFDPESGDWLPGFEAQREEWERQYAEARARFEAHRNQVEGPRAPRGASRPASPDSNAPTGTLASDEALAALRDKLSGQS